MYGESAAGAEQAGRITEGISVEAEAVDMGYRSVAYQFETSLEDRLYPHGAAPGAPQYHLKALVSYREIPVAISPDGTVSRYNVNMQADLTLTRVSDGKAVYTGRATRTGSYNNLSNAFYSTFVSSQDTLKRTAGSLAEDVQLRLAAFFAQNDIPPAFSPAASPLPGSSSRL
jgi:hypothetical protein